MQLLYPGSHSLVDSILKRLPVRNHMAELKRHHKASYNHSLRVGALAADLGRELGLPKEDVELLAMGGMLHDLGKCDVAESILSKRGRPTEEEMTELKKHPRDGFEKLSEPEFEKVRKLVVAHHEHQPNPYPRSGNDRRKEARVGEVDRRENSSHKTMLIQLITVADMFDALLSYRSYKKPLGPKETAQVLYRQFTGNRSYVSQVMKRHNESDN